MARGIYQILNTLDGKRYIGKSNNIAVRLAQHRWALKLNVRAKDTNRYLWTSVKRYGIVNFKFEIVEVLCGASEGELADRELYWMDYFKTCDRNHGYNLRRDSSTSTTVADATRELHRQRVGEKNSNYGNRWPIEMKVAMSNKKKEQHVAGRYGDEWKEKIGATITKVRSNWSPEERAEHARRTSVGRRAGFDFGQYDYNGNLIRSWGCVEEIVTDNPTHKWQNIYAACNGSKPTAYGFMWRRFPAGCVPLQIEPLVRKQMGRKAVCKN